MRLRIIFISILIFIVTSCSNNSIKNDLKEIIGHEIFLPATVDALSPENTLKLVQYQRNESCNMCKVGKLDRWLRYSGYYDKHLEFLVIISPSNNSDRAIIQQREVLEYSEKNRIVKIRFDVNNDFFKANAKIVGNEVYRTLLLDKNNKIVMVGDPMSNESINKLFIKVVANMLDHGGVYVPEY